MFTISAACRAAGIKASTLRSWERRYGLFGPGRESNERRCYSGPQVDHMAQLARLLAAGHDIGVLAGLTKDELAALENKTGQGGRKGLALRHLEKLIGLAESNDLEDLRLALGEVLSFLPLAEAVSEVLSPLLSHVGAAWAAGRLAIHREHLVVALVRQAVILAASQGRRVGGFGPMLFTTLPRELHEMGLVLAWSLAVSEGCNALYLGPSLPIDEIADAARTYGATTVVLSCVSCEPLDTSLDDIVLLRGRLDDGIALWIGAGSHHPAREAGDHPGIRLFADYTSFHRAVRQSGML